MFERSGLAGRAGILLLAARLGGAGSVADADTLLRAAEAARARPTEGRLLLRVTTLEDDRERDRAEVDVRVADGDRWLSVFRSGKQAGRRVLGVAGQTWLVVPGARRAVPIGAQNRLAGTAAIADLLGLDLRETYGGQVLPDEEAIDGARYRVLELQARLPDAPFPRATLWLAAGNSLPRRLELRLASGRPAKRMDFASYRPTPDGRFLPQRIELTDLLRKGELRTIVELLEQVPGSVDPSWFTPAGARELP